MKKIKELRARLAALLKEANDITAKADAEKRDLTEADSTAIKAKLLEVAKVKGDIATLEELATAERDAGSSITTETRSITTPGAGAGDEGDEEQEHRSAPKPKGRVGIEILPPNVRRYGQVRSFSGATREARELTAYRFGVFFAATQGRGWAQKRAKEIGIEIRLHSEGDENKGGALVPDEFENSIIDLREQYGVFRRLSRVVPMSGDTKNIPRRTGGLTAYFVGEGQTITESTKGWNLVKLTARKLAVLTKYTNELSEDAIISIGDDLMNEIVYAQSQKEDDCGFNGDGTSTYGGILGLCPKLLSLSGTIANIAGLTVSTGTGYASSYGAIVRQDFQKVKAKLPTFADTPNARWYCHKSFFAEVMEPLILAAGGATAAEIEAGGRPRFLGYDVEYVQVMPKVSAVSQVCALLGDIALASKFGDRRQNTFATSDSALNTFETDETALRGTERFDINVHDVGNASGSGPLRIPGPVVGLITAAS